MAANKCRDMKEKGHRYRVIYPLRRCSGCEISLPRCLFSVAVRWNSLSYRQSARCPPRTEEGVLLTQKSAYSPESGFPEALLHARSPQLAESTLRTFITQNQENQQGLSCHPSVLFRDFFFYVTILSSRSSSERFSRDIFVEVNADTAAAFVLWSQSEQQFFFTSETELTLCLPIASGHKVLGPHL